ncbi:MAG: hypothetical protein J3K34DRAFT_410836 [Monoraphidium minutum]|nr:MAG: hypothetical protein J3K34DRAFT_410836 [Monoraphidium minutum]
MAAAAPRRCAHLPRFAFSYPRLAPLSVRPRVQVCPPPKRPRRHARRKMRRRRHARAPHAPSRNRAKAFERRGRMPCPGVRGITAAPAPSPNPCAAATAGGPPHKPRERRPPLRRARARPPKSTCAPRRSLSTPAPDSTAPPSVNPLGRRPRTR